MEKEARKNTLGKLVGGLIKATIFKATKTAHFKATIQYYMEYAGSSNYWSDIPIIPIKWLITYDRICLGIYHKGFFIVKMGIYSLSIMFFLSSGFVIPSSSRIGVSLSVPRLKDFQDQDSGIDGNKD